VIFITGCFFFAFQGHTLEGRGGENGSKKIKQLFCALIEDFGCSFKLNFDGFDGQKW
jgi:hypothetical protein